MAFWGILVMETSIGIPKQTSIYFLVAFTTQHLLWKMD